MAKYLKTFFLGILAGLAISLGSFLFILTKTIFDGIPGAILASALFSVGLILVCIFGLNLYTGKIGVFLDVYEKIKENSINLPIILLGNAVGAIGIGALLHCFALIEVDWMQKFFNTAMAVSANKVLSHYVVLEGIFCGALVYIAVYLFKNLENWAMKIIGIIVSVTLFVYCGFQHCIANMFYFALTFDLGVWDSWANILIVILTNSVGALLVRCMVHLAAIIKQK